MVSREEALGILTRYLKDEKMVKHCIAVGAMVSWIKR
jgi:predicted hydrolase (HD superfamily)